MAPARWKTQAEPRCWRAAAFPSVADDGIVAVERDRAAEVGAAARRRRGHLRGLGPRPAGAAKEIRGLEAADEQLVPVDRDRLAKTVGPRRARRQDGFLGPRGAGAAEDIGLAIAVRSRHISRRRRDSRRRARSTSRSSRSRGNRWAAAWLAAPRTIHSRPTRRRVPGRRRRRRRRRGCRGGWRARCRTVRTAPAPLA